MKIYRYWQEKTIIETVDGTEKKLYFRAGADASPEAAAQALEEKIRKYHAVISAWENHTALPEKVRQEEYASPICEELCHKIDDRNLVTRNRYGALVLNSEELLFLDVDRVPCTFKENLRRLFRLSIPDAQERLLARLESYLHLPEFQGVGIRVYTTAKGFRVLLSLPGLETLRSPGMKTLFRQFFTDPLYAELCRKQQCFRARLTPKPARIGMKTMIKFHFPYQAKDQPAIDAFLEEYTRRSENFAVCRLTAQLGKRFSSPAIEYHDQLTGCDHRRPLA